MLSDLVKALSQPSAWLYSTRLNFATRYRKTALGPIWLLLGPSLFIALLAGLFTRVNGSSAREFVPHLGAGLVIWSFVSSNVLSASHVFVYNRAFLLQNISTQVEIVLGVIFSNVITLAHQLIVVVALIMIYRLDLTWHLLLVVPAMALVLVHAFWVMIAFGILGARYRDFGEITELVMRIAFLATPIIWIADTARDHGSVFSRYLLFNPFYHVLEPLRGALLGTPIPAAAWVISTVMACLGVVLAASLYRRLHHLVVLWI